MKERMKRENLIHEKIRQGKEKKKEYDLMVAKKKKKMK